MSSNTAHFVGYLKLEDLIAEAHRQLVSNGPINVASIQVGDRHASMPTNLTYEVQVSFVDPDGIAHYCIIQAGYVSWLHGSVFGDQAKADLVMKRADGMYELVQTFIEESGYRTRRAVLSMPLDYRTTRGDAAFLRFNKETQMFEPKPEGGS